MNLMKIYLYLLLPAETASSGSACRLHSALRTGGLQPRRGPPPCCGPVVPGAPQLPSNGSGTRHRKPGTLSLPGFFSEGFAAATWTVWLRLTTPCRPGQFLLHSQQWVTWCLVTWGLLPSLRCPGSGRG